MVPAGSIVGLQTGNAFVSDSINFGEGWAHLLAPSIGTYSAQWNTICGYLRQQHGFLQSSG